MGQLYKYRRVERNYRITFSFFLLLPVFEAEAYLIADCWGRKAARWPPLMCHWTLRPGPKLNLKQKNRKITQNSFEVIEIRNRLLTLLASISYKKAHNTTHVTLTPNRSTQSKSGVEM